MRKSIRILSFFLFASAFFMGGYFMTDGFHLNKITSIMDENRQWGLPELSDLEIKEVLEILDQKFYYLDKGRQVFVFESEDGQYVIKFFNQERFHLPSWIAKVPLPFYLDEKRKFKAEKRERRIVPSFYSLKLAYEKMKKESAIVFVQLNKTHAFQKPLKIIDPMKKERDVDLNRVEFAIQKKAQMIYPALEKIKEEKGISGLKRAIDSVLANITTRLSKGIVDDDLDVEINYAFIGEEAYLIDVGRLSEDYRVVLRHPHFKKELLKSTRFFCKWLLENHPIAYKYISERIDEILNENMLNVHEQMDLLTEGI